MFKSPFPAAVGFSCLQIDTVTPEQLLPEEKAHLSSRATTKRILDFTAGRVAARKAFQQIGLAPHAIPVGNARMPIFPPGCVGSISHASTLAVACAAERTTAKAIGLDIEQLDPSLDVQLAERIGHGIELDWLYQDPSEVTTRIVMMFSAKETIYKTFFPAIGEFFGYRAVILHHESDGHRFRVEAVDSRLCTHTGNSLYVPYIFSGDFVMTSCMVPSHAS